MFSGAAGATIWQGFEPGIQPLEPAGPVARTRYQKVPVVFPVTLYDVAAPV
jgi:hypothetical protein